MGVKKSAVCKSRPPPNGMNPASSRVSIPLMKPSTDPGASPLSACSRSPGANLEAQPAFVVYFVSLMRVRSSIAAEYTPLCYAACWLDARSPFLSLFTSFPSQDDFPAPAVIFPSPAASDDSLPLREILDSGVGLRYARYG
jgi:hypothetical protein